MPLSAFDKHAPTNHRIRSTRRQRTNYVTPRALIQSSRHFQNSTCKRSHHPSLIHHPSSSFQIGQDLARQRLHRLADLGVAEEVELVEVVVQLVELLSSLKPVRLRDLILFSGGGDKGDIHSEEGEAQFNAGYKYWKLYVYMRQTTPHITHIRDGRRHQKSVETQDPVQRVTSSDNCPPWTQPSTKKNMGPKSPYHWPRVFDVSPA